MPFWGNGGLKELGLIKPGATRVVCNLSSLGCNPYTIQALKKKNGVTVRTNPRLHAKIYVGADFAIVGSSNVSTNGLGDDGDISASSIEANIAFDDPLLVQKTQDLFEQIWKRKETRPVTGPMLLKAIKAYKNRPLWKRTASTTGLTATTLIAACLENANLCKSVYIAAYSEQLDQNGRMQISSLRKGAAPLAGGLDFKDFRQAWGYQFGQKLCKGSFVIDLWCGGKNPTVLGCSEVTGLYLRADGEPDVMVTLRGVVRSPDNGQRLPISSNEKKFLSKMASTILKHGKILLLQVVLKMARRKKISLE